jgi:hypothetical protein
MNEGINIHFSFVATFEDYEESAILLTLRLLDVIRFNFREYLFMTKGCFGGFFERWDIFRT